jgi:hypothetical protein
VLLVVDDNENLNVLVDPAVTPFDGGDDTLVGVVNHGTRPLTGIDLSGTRIFGFDGDGLCAAAGPPTGCPFGPTTYEGPNTAFNVGDPDVGVVTFTGVGVAPGGSAYFSLESETPITADNLFADDVIFAEPTGQCRSIDVIGARGANEPSAADDKDISNGGDGGMGKPVADTFRALQPLAQLAGVPLTPDPLDYPADSVATLLLDFVLPKLGGAPSVLFPDFPSVDAGVDEFTRVLTTTSPPAGTCRIAVGYSEGAWVISEALQKRPDLAAQLAGVVLYADPRFNGASGGTSSDGGTTILGEGIARVLLAFQRSSVGDPYLPDSLITAGSVLSLCRLHDPLCNFTGLSAPDFIACVQSASGGPPCAHYPTQQLTADGTSFLAEKFFGLKPLIASARRLGRSTERRTDLLAGH